MFSSSHSYNNIDFDSNAFILSSNIFYNDHIRVNPGILLRFLKFKAQRFRFLFKDRCRNHWDIAMNIFLAKIYYSLPRLLYMTYFIFQTKKRYFVAAMRQLRRLNSVSKSPIFSHFGETLTGISTIRAYRVQNRFISQMNEKIDENSHYFYPETVSNR